MSKLLNKYIAEKISMKYVVSVLYQDTFMEYHAKEVFWTSSFEEIEPKLVQVIDQVEKEIEASLLLEEGEEKYEKMQPWDILHNWEETCCIHVIPHGKLLYLFGDLDY